MEINCRTAKNNFILQVEYNNHIGSSYPVQIAKLADIVPFATTELL